MPSTKNKRSFGLFCLITSIMEEVVLVAVLLGLLPHFGIKVPIWISIILVLGWAAWSYLTYRLGKDAIGKTPVVGAETVVGSICRTKTPLCPNGYVQSGAELWQAYSISGHIDAGVEVFVVEMKGLTLFVASSSVNENKLNPE